MATQIVLKKDLIRNFFGWMNERHAIYLRRKRGDLWPWTADPVLGEYKFTNVYRELDAGTVHCREAIREPYADHEELFFNIATYRRYNLISTQQYLGYIDHYISTWYADYMLRYQKAGNQVFTGAHMLCGDIKDPKDGSIHPSKVYQIFRHSFGFLWENRRALEPQPGDNLEAAFNRLLAGKIPGFGAFICYEIVSDLRWTRYLEGADDILSWANPGPGAQRGIVRMTGNSVKDRSAYPNTAQAIVTMKHLLDISPKYLAEWMIPLEMREIEHSLCEWDKYQRATLGQGRPRQKFTPPHLRK